jgi:hypothetical protein
VALSLEAKQRTESPLDSSDMLAHMGSIGRMLILLGATLVMLGILLHFAPALPLGRLPGDLRIERPGLRVYLPITSSLLVSAVLSLALWLFSRLR